GGLMPAIQARERLMHLHEQLTGTRLHPMFVRIGGIAHEISPAWLDSLELELDSLRAIVPNMRAHAESAFAHLAGVGIITAEQVNQFGLSGIAARAGGMPIDLRIERPYLSYSHINVPLQLGKVSDIPSRLSLLAEQLESSLTIIRAATTWLRVAGAGAVNTPLPKVVRVPEGTTYLAIEGPLGVLGGLLDSSGDRTPWRLKLRTPSFAMVQSLTETLIGLPLEHLAVMLQSCTFVIGDADR
ncbi:MAG: NADH-quinone oxidoreductase subunit D, partial [Actinomycetota bacterium]|nr:NADH-quinone oxidoreductase subunit D [Actinomycetota bacterium]